MQVEYYRQYKKLKGIYMSARSPVVEAKVVVLNELPFLLAHREGVLSIYHETLWLFYFLIDLYQAVHLVLALIPQQAQCSAYGHPAEELSAFLSQSYSAVTEEETHERDLCTSEQAHLLLQKSMQRPPLQPPQHYTGDLKKDNEHLHRELTALKVELFGVYEENLRMRDMLKDQERDRQLVRECEDELLRLKGLLREVTEKREAMPSEREEIKDRIIMKLEDQLISVRIELKEAHLQLHKLTRMQ